MMEPNSIGLICTFTHSGASHDVTDNKMTPKNIITTAGRENIQIIAITDHNEISNVAAAVSFGDENGILVVPGVELSTSAGHLLSYLPSVQDLQTFHGRLDIVERDTQKSRCQTSMYECLELLDQFGGFGILAHVDSDGGLERVLPGASPHKLDVLCHSALIGIEVKSANSDISYSPPDPDVTRAEIGKKRIDILELGANQYLARVLFSDSHTLKSLGRNAAGNKRVTRIKLDKPTFAAIRIALQDADARIRLEDQVPKSIPRILGLSMRGGFLDGQSVRFSRNLNCVIGGRGTGKSATFEAVRCLSAAGSDNPIVDSEVWPDDLRLYWEDAASGRHSLQRIIGENISNLDDPEFGRTSFAIDCYGQGDTTKLSQKAQSDPYALLNYLDRFIDFNEAIQEEETIRELLLDNQTEVEEAQLKVGEIPSYKRALKDAQNQLKVLQEAKASEVITLQRQLFKEREIRSQIAKEWGEISEALEREYAKSRLSELQNIAEPDEMTLGSDELKAIMGSASDLSKDIEEQDEELEAKVKEIKTTIVEKLHAWTAKETKALQEIEDKRRDLEAQGVKLDMRFIQKLAKDEASYKRDLNVLIRWEKQLQILMRERKKLLTKRWAARQKISTKRDAYGLSASNTLEDALSDLHVSLKFSSNALSPDGTEIIKKAMDWRTSQVPRAELLIQKITIPRLLKIIENKDKDEIRQLSYPDGIKPFGIKEANDIIGKLSEQSTKFQLERVEIHDLPRLRVTKTLPDPVKKKPEYITRDFDRLSLGQQQSILLSLLLSSDGNDPLIIDQPEDNLDGEFIYSTLIPVLRRAKERRQIIVVTHNANIAVLGDAEQIIVMKSFDDRGLVHKTGSIDNPKANLLACEILEGAKEAFLRRARIYGLLQ